MFIARELIPCMIFEPERVRQS